jgi:hypothetical protein
MVAEQRQKPRGRGTRPDEDTALERLEKALEIGLLDTFPASDAIAAVQPGPKI